MLGINIVMGKQFRIVVFDNIFECSHEKEDNRKEIVSRKAKICMAFSVLGLKKYKWLMVGLCRRHVIVPICCHFLTLLSILFSLSSDCVFISQFLFPTFLDPSFTFLSSLLCHSSFISSSLSLLLFFSFTLTLFLSPTPLLSYSLY